MPLTLSKEQLDAQIELIKQTTGLNPISSTAVGEYLRIVVQFLDERAKLSEDFVTETNSSAFIQNSIQQIEALKTTVSNFAHDADNSRQATAGILVQTEAQRMAAEVAKNTALNLLTSFQELISEGFRIKGNWDITTNTPDLTTIAKASGDAYIILADATTSITGSSLPMKKGEAVAWNGTGWVYKPGATTPSDGSVNFQKLQADTATLLEKRWLKDKNPALYNAAMLSVIKAIKSVKVIGSNNNALGQRLTIGTLINADATYNYRVIIRNTAGVQIAVNNDTPSNVSGLARKYFSLGGNIYIELIIDYSGLPTGIIYNASISPIELSETVFLNNEESFAAKSAVDALAAELPAKLNISDYKALSSATPLSIEKTKTWVEPVDFTAKYASLGKLNITVTLGDAQEGFVGKIIKIVTTTTGGLCRVFEAYQIVPDKTKEMYIEFDYKIIAGTWSLTGYAQGANGSGGSQFPSSLTVALPAVAKVTRKRIRFSTTQLSTVSDAYRINNYLISSTTGAEIWISNIKVWQGDETAVVRNEDDLTPSNAKALNAVVMTESDVTALFAGTSVPEALRAPKNLRLSFAGSSVTWGDGFLQSVAAKEVINRYQKEAGKTIEQDSVVISSATSNTLLNSANDRKLFNGQGRKMTGVAASLAFSIDGDELSICQLIERSNVNAAEIELYVDGILHDTFNNFNPTLGAEVKNFVGNGVDTKFDLGRAFTYGHAVTVDGVAKIGTLYATSSSIPVGDDYMIIRKYGTHPVTGAVEVHHWIWFAVAPANGLPIVVNQNFGEEICYEKTTIGKSTAGILENASGEGSVSYDPVNPSALSSGLDFRETDFRSIKTWRFSTSKLRVIQLKIKGLHPAGSGTPYFVFNFATSRILFFQNAGIGGWQSKDFNNDTKLCSYKQIIDFNPDILIYESTPNDDWDVRGHKLSTNYSGLTLTEFRKRRTFPAKSFSHAAAVYGYQKWVGKIQAIEPGRVQILQDADHIIDSNPAPGDVVMIGGYYSNNKEYVSRIVASYDSVNRWVTFDRPIQKRDYIYTDLNQFVGMEVRVRDLANYVTETRKLIETIKNAVPDVKIGMIPNPLPNLQIRELWGYPEKIDALSDIIDAYNIDMDLVYKWQYSQPKTSSLVVDAVNLTLDPETGRMAVELATLSAGVNYFNVEVIVNGVDVYGKDAVLQTSLAYAPSQSLSGNAVAFTPASSGYTTKMNQVSNVLKPRLEFLQNAPVSGNITVKYAPVRWSSDSCHLSNNSAGAQLYGNAYISAIRELVSIADRSTKKVPALNVNTVTLPQLAQALIDAGYVKQF